MTVSAEVKTFRWMPLDNQHHAIPGDTLARDTPVTTLCGHATVMPDHEPTKREWLWWTCGACYEKAKRCRHVALTSPK